VKTKKKGRGIGQKKTVKDLREDLRRLWGGKTLERIGGKKASKGGARANEEAGSGGRRGGGGTRKKGFALSESMDKGKTTGASFGPGVCRESKSAKEGTKKGEGENPKGRIKMQERGQRNGSSGTSGGNGFLESPGNICPAKTGALVGEERNPEIMRYRGGPIKNRKSREGGNYH